MSKLDVKAQAFAAAQLALIETITRTGVNVSDFPEFSEVEMRKVAEEVSRRTGEAEEALNGIPLEIPSCIPANLHGRADSSEALVIPNPAVTQSLQQDGSQSNKPKRPLPCNKNQLTRGRQNGYINGLLTKCFKNPSLKCARELLLMK